MSGTSVDGIDTSLVFTNGKKVEKTNFNLMEPYSSNTKIKILKVLENPKLNIKNSKFLNELEHQITFEHETITKKLIKILTFNQN